MQKVTKTINNYGTTVYRNEKGQYHNETGPAIIWSNGSVQYCINGEYIQSLKEFQRLSNSTEEDMTVMILKYGHSGFTKE